MTTTTTKPATYSRAEGGKTRARIEAHAFVSKRAGDVWAEEKENGIWAVLVPGYVAAGTDCHTAHEWSWGDLERAVRGAYTCTCDDCDHDVAEAVAAGRPHNPDHPVAVRIREEAAAVVAAEPLSIPAGSKASLEELRAADLEGATKDAAAKVVALREAEADGGEFSLVVDGLKREPGTVHVFNAAGSGVTPDGTEITGDDAWAVEVRPDCGTVRVFAVASVDSVERFTPRTGARSRAPAGMVAPALVAADAKRAEIVIADADKLGSDVAPPPYLTHNGSRLVVDGVEVATFDNTREARLALAAELESRRVVDPDTFPRCVTCKTGAVARVDLNECDQCTEDRAATRRALDKSLGGAS